MDDGRAERLVTLRNRAKQLRQRSDRLRDEVQVLVRQADQLLESRRDLSEPVDPTLRARLRPRPASTVAGRMPSHGA